MSEQETTRPSLKGIESARSQITNKYKGGHEDEEETKGMDSVNDFLLRIGADETVVEPEEEKAGVQDIKDIFATLTSVDDGKAEDEDDILKPEMSYQEIPSAEPEEEEQADIYAKDSEETIENTSEEEHTDEFLKNFSSDSIKPADNQPSGISGSRDKDLQYSKGEFIIVEESDGNLLIVFEKGGENAVSLKMPALSIPEGYPVNAMLAPDINLSLTYNRKETNMLTVLLNYGESAVRTEVIPGKPFIRRIAFGGMEFELFAGAEVTAGLFSIFVEEKRIIYKY